VLFFDPASKSAVFFEKYFLLYRQISF
jgi:hypothetical protein